MKLLFFFILVSFQSLRILAQTQAENKESPDIFKVVTESSDDQGKVTIKQDERIKALITRYIESRKKDGKIPGYKIRIYSDSGQSARQKAYSEAARFSSAFPALPAPSVEYETPNFKVYIGGFRTKNDAFKAYKQIMKDFKYAFLVPARINLPKI